MKEILPNIFAVEVREDFVHGEIISMTDAVLLRLTAMNQSTTTHSEIALSPGSYEILFTSKECTEEQAFEIAERQGGGWKDYDPDNNPPRYAFVSAVGSINSLLRSHGLDENKNYLLLKKIS